MLIIAQRKSQQSASGFERHENCKNAWRVCEWILPLIALVLTMSLLGCGEAAGQLKPSKKLLIKHFLKQYTEDASKLNWLVAGGNDYSKLNEKYSNLIESQLLTDATPEELGDIAIYVDSQSPGDQCLNAVCMATFCGAINKLGQSKELAASKSLDRVKYYLIIHGDLDGYLSESIDEAQMMQRKGK